MQVSYDSLTGQKKYKVIGLNSETISELKSLITKKDTVVAITSPTQFRVLTEDKRIVEFESEKPESLSHWLKEFDILNYDFMKQPHDFIIHISKTHTGAVLQNNNVDEPYYFQFDISLKDYNGEVNKENALQSIIGGKCELLYEPTNSSLVENSNQLAGVPRVIDHSIKQHKKHFELNKNFIHEPSIDHLPLLYEDFTNKPSLLETTFTNFKDSSVLLFKISEKQFENILNEMSLFSRGCESNLMQYNTIPNSLQPWKTNCVDSVYRVTQNSLELNYANFLDSDVFRQKITEANSFSLVYLKLEDSSFLSKLEILGSFLKTASYKIYTHINNIIHKKFGIFEPIETEQEMAINADDEVIYVENKNLFSCKNSNEYGALLAHTPDGAISSGYLLSANEVCFRYYTKETNPEEKICVTIAKFEDNFVHEIDCEKEIRIDENQCWYEN